jgi:hypothetical protein
MTRDNEPKEDNIDEEIRLRAYYRFLARGPDDGSDINDWLRAAEEIREGRKARRVDNPVSDDTTA